MNEKQINKKKFVRVLRYQHLNIIVLLICMCILAMCWKKNHDIVIVQALESQFENKLFFFFCNEYTNTCMRMTNESTVCLNVVIVTFSHNQHNCSSKKWNPRNHEKCLKKIEEMEKTKTHSHKCVATELMMTLIHVFLSVYFLRFALYLQHPNEHVWWLDFVKDKAFLFKKKRMKKQQRLTQRLLRATRTLFCYIYLY